MPTPLYDVCVIGSGAAGGIMTKELCEGGAKVILLEAGAEVKPHQFRSHCWPSDMQFRGYRNEKQDLFYPGDVRDSIRYQNSDRVSVDRIRVLGGRTVHWNAVVLRYSHSDFREYTLNGFDTDWPISYEEIAPYYERIEQSIGVCGNDDGIETLPAGRHYLPPLPLRCSEQILRRETRGMGVKVISVRKALLTRDYDNRPACHYCGHCMDGCDVSAIYSTPGSMLPKARRTGNLTLRQNALAREILLDKTGLARGVSIVDRNTGGEEEIRARIVVVCCATIETARLLLNSKSPSHPDGLANSSGVVGRYLHGHSSGAMHMYLKELEGRPAGNQDGALDQCLIPRWDTESFRGTYDFQVNYSGYMFPFQARSVRGYGSAFKKRVRDMQPGFLMLGGFCKVTSHADNRVTVDPHTTDAHGIPIPVVQFRFHDMDKEIYSAMRTSALEMSDRLKAEVTSAPPAEPSGFASHENGTVRMGTDPKSSALNSFCQSHDVKNLFVTDGSTFPSSAEKNPTLTIMALSLRAADYIKDRRRKGEL
jgi:choline dehydrogenase-like flavoprotein